MRRHRPSTAAFSLVEVVVALGVVVFCLITVLGLLAISVNTTHDSTIQTSATNILNAVAADVESTPNVVWNYTNAAVKGSVAESSAIYGIAVPASGAAATSTPTTIYVGEDGQVTTAASALYQLNVWTTGATTTQQETLVRLLISWPAAAPYTNAQGYVENVVAMNRN